MTPKKHAQNLYDIYYYKLYELSSYAVPADIKNQAVACALTCVDELIKQSKSFDYNLYISRLEYLDKVKQEINKSWK